MTTNLPVYDRRTGQGPTLVFLHYWGGSAGTWSAVVDHLPGRDLLAMDFRGWARSRQLSGPYTLRQYTDDVLAVLRDAQVTDFVLVGHSMGGKVAQLVAATKPAGLRGLVVVAPGPAVPAPHVTAQYRAQLSRAYDTVESTTFARDQVLTALPLPASVADQVVSDSRSSAASAATEWPLRGIAEDISLSARRIEAPVLVVAGEHDRVEPAEVLRSHLVPYLDDVEMTVVPGSGHLIPLEAAGELANLITMFEHRRAGAACGAARQ